MPDESCRRCGGVLIDFSQCAECKQVIRMICKSCHRKTLEKYHSQCIEFSECENQKLSLIDNFSNFVVA